MVSKQIVPFLLYKIVSLCCYDLLCALITMVVTGEFVNTLKYNMRL